MELNKEAFMKSIKDIVGESTSDESLKFVQDMTDTYISLEKKTGTADEWKKKYEENDKKWREKYKETFFGGVTEEDKKQNEDNTPKPKTFEDLFKEKDKK